MEEGVRFCFLTIPFLLSGLLFGQEKEAGKASAYYEAREYAKALDLYDVLLKQNLTPWQKSVLQYNKGSVLFEEGNLSGAIAQWKAIPFSQDPFPLLTRRLYTNLAVARLQQATQLTLDQTASFERANFLLQEALAYVRKAMAEECRLQKVEGASTCVPEQDLTSLYAAVKSLYAKGAREWQRFEQVYATPSQRLYLLLGSITLLQQRLHFLSGQTKETDAYRSLFADEGRRWLPIWHSTEKEIPKLKEENSKLFSKAKSNYEDSLTDLEKQAYSESLDKLDRAFNQLMALASQIGLNEPIATATRHLLSSYQLALIEEPLQELAIAELLAEQQALLEPLRSSLDADQLKAFELANKDLSLSQEALKHSLVLTGRFYFTEARYRLTKILRPAKRGSEINPLEILANALDEQHQAIVLNRLAERMEGSEKRDETMMERIVIAQKAVVDAASPFLEAVYHQQVRDFRQPGSLEERCQAHPWDAVLPLYELGFRSASNAAENTRSSLHMQEEAMHHWNKALALLKKPKSAFKGSCQKSGGGGGASPEKGSEKTAPEEKPAVPMNEVMHHIQQMEEEDRKPQTAPSPPKGEKPW